jgi:putative zinc finger/helix-turn-helix YgiT family protein
MSDPSLEGHLHRNCGGRYTLAAETVTVRVSGMTATVERRLYRCGKCGDEQRTLEQREAAEGEAIARIRTQHTLLTPREIRQLRERLGLTHQQLGELLYGTPKEIVEGWERGRYLQNAQVDAMLRALLDPEQLERRAAKAGVVLPTSSGATSSGAGVETSGFENTSAQRLAISTQRSAASSRENGSTQQSAFGSQHPDG